MGERRSGDDAPEGRPGASPAVSPEVPKAGVDRAPDPTAPQPSGASSPELATALPEEAPLLGRPPRPDEPERPAIGESASQASPGAFGEHANPIAPEDPAKSGGSHERRLEPGEVLKPRPAPRMTATGAARGPHPPAPPYGGPERRVAQHDWDRWRAEERRQAPFRYPEWRT